MENTINNNYGEIETLPHSFKLTLQDNKIKWVENQTAQDLINSIPKDTDTLLSLMTKGKYKRSVKR